jgi:hypothetical protein
MSMNVFRFTLFLLFALSGASTHAADDSKKDAKELSGMSILGNSEAPKSLVIVPWKTAEIGDGIGVSNMLDERARPVDKDVFVRELDYFELRTSPPTRAAAQIAAQEQATSANTVAKP